MRKTKHECEHMDEKERGACRSCLEPMAIKPSRFVGSLLPWRLEFRGLWVKSYRTLNKALVDTANQTWKDYMLITPNGVKLSIAVGRLAPNE